MYGTGHSGVFGGRHSWTHWCEPPRTGWQPTETNAQVRALCVRRRTRQSRLRIRRSGFESVRARFASPQVNGGTSTGAPPHESQCRLDHEPSMTSGVAPRPRSGARRRRTWLDPLGLFQYAVIGSGRAQAGDGIGRSWVFRVVVAGRNGAMAGSSTITAAVRVTRRFWKTTPVALDRRARRGRTSTRAGHLQCRPALTVRPPHGTR